MARDRAAWALPNRRLHTYNLPMTSHPPETVIILDFETSGISPDHGDRAIEIGAVKLCGNQVVDRFQSLMNPGLRISSFIESYTGISNAMVQQAPAAAEVMREFAGFIGATPLVAHNASFDRRFLNAELARIGQPRRENFGCSMLAARRVYPAAPNHKLETLVRYRHLACDGTFHRALADAEMTARLWVAMQQDLRDAYGFGRVTFALMRDLAKVPKAQVPAYLSQRRDAEEASRCG